MKIKLEMDRERAIMLMRACETIARVGMGQFAEMASLLRPDMNYDETHEIEHYLKEKIYPQLSSQGYHGIRQESVPEETQVAWDTYQHLRREISWFDAGKDWRTNQRDWNKMMGVHYDEPFKVSKLPGDFKTERVE